MFNMRHLKTLTLITTLVIMLCAGKAFAQTAPEMAPARSGPSKEQLSKAGSDAASRLTEQSPDKIEVINTQQPMPQLEKGNTTETENSVRMATPKSATLGLDKTAAVSAAQGNGNHPRRAEHESVTVFESSTGTNKYVPVYGWYYDINNTTSQMIYPASLLGDVLYVGDQITQITFYTDANGIKFKGGKITVTIGETTTNYFASEALISVPSTTVSGTVVPTQGSTTLTVAFSEPLEYTGDNLFVQVENTQTGTCDPYSNNTLWIGQDGLQDTEGNAWPASYCNKGSAGRQAFLPKMTIYKSHPSLDELEARDITVKDEAFFSGKSYTWTDSEGTHTSYLNEPATTPEQMIAMLQKVYTDPEIPGNLKRGFSAYGTDAGETNQAVYYQGVGGVQRTGTYVDAADSYVYDDTYGWGITGNINEVQQSSYLAWHNSSSPYVDYFAYYAALDKHQYTPDQEGLTLLLVELKDTYEDGSNNTIASGTYDTEYDRLKAYFANTVKSVRIITQAKRTGEGVEAGTLFKIDCEKMNKFFLLAKGQLHLDHNSYYYTDYNASSIFTSGSQELDANWDFAPEPGYIYYYKNTYTSYDNWYNDNNPTWGGIGAVAHCDRNTGPLFYHMFEQFSPSMPSDSVGSLDLYQNMTTNMESFPVIHDCLGITIMNHQFMLYGADSQDDDCQDIHDLMFFVPDYRMLKDNQRDPGEHVQQYLNYTQDHKPTMGMFVIKQYPITGQQIDGQDTYKLHLTWTSNLLDFLPGEDGKYTLYRVITNPDGTKTYQKVGNFNPNTLEYYDNVPMQHNGQQVTYVVQGQDVGEFLDLQMSNEESFIIPGLDRAEQIRIALNSDYYFSRYDAADQTNNYSNSLIANNTIGTNVKPQYIENGSQFKFWRATIDEQTGDVVTPDEPFVVAEVSNWNPATGGTLTYKDWNDQTDFSSKPYGHGYHANVTTSTISVANGEVVFDGLKLYDNFSVSVEENTHPSQYVYYVTLETAVPFGLNQNLPSVATWQEDKIFAYFEVPYNDWYEVRAYAWNGDDKFAGEWAGTEMTWVGTHDGKNVYQWSIPARDNGALPANVIFSYKDGLHTWHKTQDLSFDNGGYYTITNVGSGEEQVTGGLVATTSADNTSNQARSNTVSVPVYKTEMAMNPINAQDVDNDVKHQLPVATTFDVNTRYSSRSEILGYYIYRWADSEDTPTIYEDDGADASPQGQAGNQGEYYTVAMNNDFTGRTENFGANYADVTASFVDNYMTTEAEEADTYTYAPVVELFAPVQAVNLSDESDRTDYNTYGGPQQMTAGAKITIADGQNKMSLYKWTVDTITYRYYNVPVSISALDVPNGYEVYKIRAWRQADVSLLAEQHANRADRVSADYLFEDLNYGDDTGDGPTNADNLNHYQLGSRARPDAQDGIEEVMATFGAKDVETHGKMDVNIVVRVYFTKKAAEPASGAPRRALSPDNLSADGKYYVAETEKTVTLTSGLPTEVNNVSVNREVKSVTYVNSLGMQSSQPFSGVNVVVTRYTDGTTTTTKIVK